MAVTPCEQALQSDWPAKRAGGERMSKRQTPPIAPAFPFTRYPQMKSMLGGYGCYEEFIFEGRGSTCVKIVSTYLTDIFFPLEKIISMAKTVLLQ